MKIFIKYMISKRCKMVVKSELDNLGLHYLKVELGEVTVKENLTDEQRNLLRSGLLRSGLELMDDKNANLIEKIKNLIVEMVHYSEEVPKINFSDFLTEKLNYEYTYLANLFSELTGLTIAQFMMAHKIERVKELLIYDELTLTEIAYKMNYSSIAHLSNQFKKVTGLTPTFFKELKQIKRIPLEDV